MLPPFNPLSHALDYAHLCKALHCKRFKLDGISFFFFTHPTACQSKEINSLPRVSKGALENQPFREIPPDLYCLVHLLSVTALYLIANQVIALTSSGITLLHYGSFFRSCRLELCTSIFCWMWEHNRADGAG